MPDDTRIFPYPLAGATGLVINSTTDLACLVPIESLREHFWEAVEEASLCQLRYKREGRTTSNAMLLREVLDERLRALGSLRVEELNTGFSFFQGFTQDNPDEGAVRVAESALMIDGLNKSRRIIVNRWLKHVFLILWRRKSLLLPMTFKIGSSFAKSDMCEFLPEIATCHYENTGREVQSFGIRLTLASIWREFEEIDLDELGAFSLHLCESRENMERLGHRITNPYSKFTAAIRDWSRAGGTAFRYDEPQLAYYLIWLRARRDGRTESKFSDYLVTEEHAEERHRARAASRLRHRVKKDLAQLSVDVVEERDEIAKLISDGTPLKLAKFQTIAATANCEDQVLIYFRMLRARGGRNGMPTYPGREDKVPQLVANSWENVFDHYGKHRAKIGYEAQANWRTFSYVLKDYVLCYLPWWQELYTGIEVTVPVDPSLFARFEHWTDTEIDSVAPMPALEFYKKVRAGTESEGVNGFIRDTYSFFEFARAFAKPLKLAREEFANPITPEIDCSIVKRSGKTNKVPIDKGIIPYLLRYAYAIEAFYESLLGKAVDNGFEPWERSKIWYAARDQSRLIASEWGLAPGFTYEDRHFTIAEVPLLNWVDTAVYSENGPQDVFVPLIGPLRLAIGALETGIRFQGLQWLCRKTYDSFYSSQLVGAELVPLLVNTDKTRDQPWKTQIVRRARELLGREERFQLLLADRNIERLVAYEQREYTRFAPVLPLFRRPGTDYPVGDHSYAQAWERLIVSFTTWYNETFTDKPRLVMWSMTPDLDPLTGKPREAIVSDGDGDRPCSILKMRLRHTPHSARATFITARAGILPIEVTAWLVGHTNVATTHHYTVEDEGEIARKIILASDTIFGSGPRDAVTIRADAIDSALRRSFDKDRRDTERDFCFQSLSLLNETQDALEGVRLLRTTNMSRIAFRETHVCPVGECCPTDVLETIVEPRRCGLCPLAVKSVDHLPSIGAKLRYLLEQIREATALLAVMAKRGEAADSIEEVQRRRKLDVLEYEGWRTTLLCLEKALEDLEARSEDTYLVALPDAVRLHLKAVSRDSDAAEFLFHRIVDSRAYTIFETPEVRAKAARLRKRLLFDGDALTAELDGLEDADPVAALLQALRVRLAALGIEATGASALTAFRSLLDTKRAPSERPALLRTEA